MHNAPQEYNPAVPADAVVIIDMLTRKIMLDREQHEVFRLALETVRTACDTPAAATAE